MDPEFLIGGVRGSIATERRESTTKYLQVLVLSDHILTVTHTYNRHFQSIYMNRRTGIRAYLGL